MDYSPKETTKVVNDIAIQATHLPFRCPVCNGFGTLKYGAVACQACEGKGFVVVKQDGGERHENENSTH